MRKKQQIIIGVVSGLVFIITYLLLALFVFKCPTEGQYVALRITISLGAASFATVIPGFIQVKYKDLITASGAIAVFVVVMLINPKPIGSYSDCNAGVTEQPDKKQSDKEIRIAGNVFLDNKPFEMAEVYLIELDTRRMFTNENGYFSYRLEEKINFDELTIRVKSSTLKIDTSIAVKNYLNPLKLRLYYKAPQFDTTNNSRNNLMASAEITPIRRVVKRQTTPKGMFKLKNYCLVCTAKDSLGNVVNVKNRCNSDSLYLVNYIKGFTQSSKDQSFTAVCKWAK